jgi:hypothetical protein
MTGMIAVIILNKLEIFVNGICINIKKITAEMLCIYLMISKKDLSFRKC